MSFRNKKKQKLKRFAAFGKLDKLQEAAFLMDSKMFNEAMPFLEEATRQYPNEAEFWEMLGFAASETGDVSTMQKAFKKLAQIQPRNAEAAFNLAFTYGLDNRIALSRKYFREFYEKFPEHEQSAEALKLAQHAEKELERLLAEFDFPEGDEGFRLACLHEEAQVLMNQHRFKEAQEKSEKLISQMPEFVSAYNNLSLILYMSGETEKAVETARKALSIQPENFHALSNLTRFLVFLGEQDEARQFADRLQAVESDNPDVFVKKLEAFTFVGDDEATIKIFKEAEKKKAGFSEQLNFARHLAAFAFYHLGEEKKAEKIWREILKDEPDFDLAAANLEELKLHEREVFALPLRYWIPARYINELFASLGKVKDGRNFEKNLQKKLTAFFEKNPNIVKVFPVLFERGDAAAKEFAIKLLDWAGTPEAHSILKDYALGQSGSDKMRHQAAMALSRVDAIPSKVRMWQGGEWQELMLMNFEITDEPTDVYPMKMKAQQFLRKGLEAMHKENLDLAEQYFRKALEANGAEHPSLLYNLLAIEQYRGSVEEANKKLRKIVEKFPDYSFAAISLAASEVKKGNIEAAKNLVERFYEKKRWHFSEIKIWFYFNLEMALAEKHFDSARMSLDMLEQFDENLDRKYWDELISEMELLDKISGIPNKLLGRKKKKQSVLKNER